MTIRSGMTAIAAGVLATLAVAAIGIVRPVPIGPKFAIAPAAGGFDRDDRPFLPAGEAWVARERAYERSNATAIVTRLRHSAVTSTGEPSACRHVDVERQAVGWPWRAFEARVFRLVPGPAPRAGDPATTWAADGVIASRSPRSDERFATVIPLRPRPGEAIANVATFATAWWLAATGFVALRSRRRLTRGACPRCGYPLEGARTCPECGSRVRERPIPSEA